MQDIKKPYSRSRSNHDIASRVEQFEKRSYLLNKKEHVMDNDMHIRRNKSDEAEEDYNNNKFSKTKSLRRRGNWGTILFIIFIIITVVIIGLYTYVFNKATITFIPKKEDIDVNRSFVLSSVKDDVGAVYFEMATSSVSKSKSLPLSENKKVESKASGKIIIYNNYDTAPQKLIKNTRFESSNGNIYRINDSITIPGKKGNTPGSLEVTIYADSYGSKYNIPPSDFTIPGFKGSPRYKTFYGRGVGNISGGNSGDTPLVSASDLNGAKDELAIELGKTVKEKMKELKKDGFYGLYDNIQIVYEDNSQDLKSGNDSTYKVTATGYLVFIDESKLAKAVASTLREYNDEPVKLKYQDTLKFSFKDLTDLSKDKNILTLVEGNPRVVFVADEKGVRKSLIGKDRDEFASVMKNISAVEKAEIDFSPFWLSSFPKKESSILFVENIPKR